MPTKTWVVGEEVLAADFNTFVQKQVVATFANAAARDAALPAPTIGMMCFLNDVQSLQVYAGSAWREIAAGGSSNYVQLTSNSGSVASTPLAIPGLTVVVNLAVARRLKVTASAPVAKASTGDYVSMTIRHNGTQKGGTFMTQPTTSVFTHTVNFVTTGVVGANTFDLYLMCFTGTAMIQAAPDMPATHLVEILPS